MFVYPTGVTAIISVDFQLHQRLQVRVRQVVQAAEHGHDRLRSFVALQEGLVLDYGVDQLGFLKTDVLSQISRRGHPHFAESLRVGGSLVVDDPLDHSNVSFVHPQIPGLLSLIWLDGAQSASK